MATKKNQQHMHSSSSSRRSEDEGRARRKETRMPMQQQQGSLNDSLALCEELDDLIIVSHDLPDESRLDELEDEFDPWSHRIVSKGHWKKAESRKRCADLTCNKEFINLINQKEWCRRCGNIFCKKCLTFRLKLSPFGELDVNGRFMPVCRLCFTPPAQKIGARRSHSALFLSRRHDIQGKKYASFNRRSASLAEAFAKRSLVSKTLTVVNVSTPDWLKVNWSKTDENFVKSCPVCLSPFSLFKRRHHCAICGSVHCETCLLNSIQLYAVEGEGKICLADPDFNPPNGEVVRGCQACLETIKYNIARKQRLSSLHSSSPSIDSRISSLSSTPSTPMLPSSPTSTDSNQNQNQYGHKFKFIRPLTPWEADLLQIFTDLGNQKTQVLKCLPEFQSLVNALSGNGELPMGRGFVPKLAKYQCDLSQALTQYAVLLQKLKAIIQRCETDQERLLVSNIVKGSLTFYTDNMWLYKALKRDLSASMPESSLTLIKDEVNKNVLNYSLLLITQLGYESVAFPSFTRLSQALLHAVEVIGKDLKIVMKLADGEFEEYNADITRVVKIMGKETPLLLRFLSLPSAKQFAQVTKRIDGCLKTVVKQLQLNGTVEANKKSLEALFIAWDELASLTSPPTDLESSGWEVL